MNKKNNLKKYLNVISEPNRLFILNILKEGERCACQIHPSLKLSQNLTSHHLKILKDLGLIKSRRVGLNILYSRNEKIINFYQEELNKIII